MPEFILNKPRKSHPFYDLDDFTKGYIEAMFFTGDGESEEFRFNDLGVDRLTKEAVKRIAADCRKFLNKDLVSTALELADRRGYTIDRAGNDLWYTRQGHGVGYWARKVLADIYVYPKSMGYARVEVGDWLTAKAKELGEATTYDYRGWIHHD